MKTTDDHRLAQVIRHPEDPKVPDKFRVEHLDDRESRIILIEPSVSEPTNSQPQSKSQKAQ